MPKDGVDLGEAFRIRPQTVTGVERQGAVLGSLRTPQDVIAVFLKDLTPCKPGSIREITSLRDALGRGLSEARSSGDVDRERSFASAYARVGAVVAQRDMVMSHRALVHLKAGGSWTDLSKQGTRPGVNP